MMSIDRFMGLDMGTMEAARLAFAEAALPREKVVAVRVALRAAAARVRAVTAESCGELAAEGRTLWLYSLLPLASLHDLAGALTLANDVVRFLENWSDCARPRSSCPERDLLEEAAESCAELAGKPDVSVGDGQVLTSARALFVARAAKVDRSKSAYERDAEAFHENHVVPALVAAQGALEALVELVDEMREGAPEVLR